MPGGMRFRGPVELRPMLETYRNAFPDVHHKTVAVVETGDSIAVELKIVMTHTGVFATPMGDLPPTGRAVTLDACDVVRVGPDGRSSPGTPTSTRPASWPNSASASESTSSNWWLIATVGRSSRNWRAATGASVSSRSWSANHKAWCLPSRGVARRQPRHILAQLSGPPRHLPAGSMSFRCRDLMRAAGTALHPGPRPGGADGLRRHVA